MRLPSMVIPKVLRSTISAGTVNRTLRGGLTVATPHSRLEIRSCDTTGSTFRDVASEHGSTSMLVATVMMAGAVCSSAVVQCDDSPCNDKVSSSVKSPIWPTGVNPEDIEELVDEIMNDPEVNLSLIPDALERRIYKSTIQLTLNAFYIALGSIDGAPFLSHQIKVERVTKRDAISKERTKQFLTDQTKNVNVAILEEIADRLLANPAINAKLLPDSIEKQVYVNCLLVIFRVLSVIVHSFRITVCGHDFGLTLEPHQFEESAMNAMAHSSLSQLDINQIKSFAESCGIPPDDDDSLTEELSFLDRLLGRRSFMVKLHTCMYTLVLGILDDLLANTKIRVLSDEVSVDVVPTRSTPTQKNTTKPRYDNDKASTATSIEEYSSATVKSRGVGYVPAITFVSGLVLGVTVSVMGSKR